MDTNRLGLALDVPLLAGVLEVADQLLLLGVDRHDGLASRHEIGRGLVDMLELRVAVRRLLALACLADDLKAVAEVAQEQADRGRADLVPHGAKLRGELFLALASPPERRLRVAARHRIHQCIEVLHQRRVRVDERRPARARSANPLLAWRNRWRVVRHLVEIANPGAHTLLADAGCFDHRGDTAMTEHLGLSGRPKTGHALAHRVPQSLVLRPDLIHLPHPGR